MKKSEQLLLKIETHNTPNLSIKEINELGDLRMKLKDLLTNNATSMS